MQRLRVTFSRGERTKYITHLDLMRFWERAFRRAHLPIAHSEGFRPHPRFALAAPLPVGVTSEGELMDVFLQTAAEPAQFLKALAAQAVSDIQVLAAEEAGLETPSLQSLMRYAEYRVDVEASRPYQEVAEAIDKLMAMPALPWEHIRDGELRQYDLRAQIDALWLEHWSDSLIGLGMRLQTDSNGAGRPEQVARALGFSDPPVSIHRTRLILAQFHEGARPPVKRPRTYSRHTS